MGRLTNQHLSNLIRSAKPEAQPSQAFMDRLSEELKSQPLPPTPQRAWKPWLGMFGAGLVTAIICAFVLIPKWFNPTTPLHGYIQKGPFISGTAITIQELDNRLQPTGISYQVTTTSDFGDYRLSREIKSRYVEVIAQGFYYNEVSGKLSEAPLTLRAIADTSATHTINVNVLTTLIAPRIRHIVISDDIDFGLAKRIAEEEVLGVFKVEGDVEGNFEAMDISTGGKQNGILLAVSILLQGQQSVAELSELLSKLSLAIKTDGQLLHNGKLLEAMRGNALTLDTEQITANLQQRYAKLGVTVAIPDFTEFLKPFVTE